MESRGWIMMTLSFQIVVIIISSRQLAGTQADKIFLSGEIFSVARVSRVWMLAGDLRSRDGGVCSYKASQ